MALQSFDNLMVLQSSIMILIQLRSSLCWQTPVNRSLPVWPEYSGKAQTHRHSKYPFGSLLRFALKRKQHRCKQNIKVCVTPEIPYITWSFHISIITTCYITKPLPAIIYECHRKSH